MLRELSKSSGTQLLRSDATLVAGLRKLKLAVEDAKIELTRASSASVLVPALTLGSNVVDVDVTLTRDDLHRLCVPLVDRSIAVSQLESLAPLPAMIDTVMHKRRDELFEELESRMQRLKRREAENTRLPDVEE